MASKVGGAVAGKVCEMAVEMAVQQISLVKNFQEHFEWMKKELIYVKGFLNDADQQCRQNETVKQWLNDVRDIALRAEDICELCSVQPLYSKRYLSVLTGNHLVFRYKMAQKISEVKDRINSLIEEARRLKIAYDVLSGAEALNRTFQRSEWKRSSIVRIDSHPVGIEAKVEHLISLLEKPEVSVIAVVGMGGLGKTYLLQNFYNITKGRFDFEISIWLSISQSFYISKLQHDIASHLGIKNEIDGVSEERAAELINLHLKEKKILIVLDDVWKPIKEDNMIERLGLTISPNCKLVITTRNKEVCRNVKAEIYEMECLYEEDSWKLFCIFGFPECEENRAPEHLVDVARNIVKECGNLPLAIKTTAASLAGATDRREWDSKLSQLKKVSILNEPMEVLKLSYDCLPVHLRACFSYLSFFPEDEKIDCEYLVNLWIGEGLIPDGDDQWDIGWNYLYQIANLCFVEVVEEQVDKEREVEGTEVKKYCIVHDLILDLAVYISKENKCAFDVEEAFTKSPSSKNSVDWCRVLLPKKSIDDRVMAQSLPAYSPKLLRTLSLYNNYIDSIPSKFLMNMKVVRVLDLSRTGISTLPDCVGDMKLLKVLNLSHTRIEEVPGCVRRFQHINISIDALPKGISNLPSLRTLRSKHLRLSVENEQELKLEDVGRMFQLQELSIWLHRESQLESIKEGILGQLVKMRHLSIVQNGSHVPLFPEKLGIMGDLEKLEVSCFSVTGFLYSFVNLRELVLQACPWSSYPEFQNMPNLVSLRLEYNKSCREIPKAFGKSGGFPKLRFLLIRYFNELEEFPELEDGAMPRLQIFKLQNCKRLRKVPEGLEELKMLREFNYDDKTGTHELRERLKEGGEDWQKVKARNPRVIITGK